MWMALGVRDTCLHSLPMLVTTDVFALPFSNYRSLSPSDAVIWKASCLHRFVRHTLPGQDKKRQGKARQDKTRQGKTRQGNIRQDKTRQDKTRQDTTRQDTTRQDTTTLGRSNATGNVLIPMEMLLLPPTHIKTRTNAHIGTSTVEDAVLFA